MSIFSKVSAPKLKSSNFNLSEEHRLSMNMGDLVPIMCKEVLPGDKFKVSTELSIKLAPLKAPVMHRITAYVHYFFVPTFQVNHVFQDFINPKVNQDNSIVLPFVEPSTLKAFAQVNSGSGGFIGSLADYLGLPITQSAWLDTLGSAAYQETIGIDPFRCYQHIYNSFYRDQNLEPLEGASPASSSLFLVERYAGLSGKVTLSGTSLGYSNQFTQLFKLRKRAWAKDYFTSALPSPQAGDDVLIPISSEVSSDGAMRFDTRTLEGEGAPLSGQEAFFGPITQIDEDNPLTDIDGNPAYYKSGLKAVNSTATINDLRKAMALQRFKELAERGGTRYSEMVRNFFGAFLKDYWVDRPIFLGGQKQAVKVSEMFQTSQTSGTEALGERAGIGHSYGFTKGVYLNAPCHGYLMGILSIRPEAVYTQGLERMWTRKSLFDFAFPQFATMGEQEIYQKELFVGADGDANNTVFGYTPRYAEYKTSKSYVSGEFRTSLNYWHFARQFDNAPTLSSQFVMMNNVPTRPFNVTDPTAEHIYVDLYNNIYARRRLPYFGTPSAIL